MNFQKAIDLLEEYHRLCQKHNVSFPWNYPGLIENSQNIKVKIVLKKIRDIKEAYEGSKKEEKGSASKMSTKKNRIKSANRRSPKKKAAKKEIHITTVKLNRSETEIRKRKKKSKKKKYIRKAKKAKPLNRKRRRAKIFRGGLPRH